MTRNIINHYKYKYNNQHDTNIAIKITIENLYVFTVTNQRY